MVFAAALITRFSLLVYLLIWVIDGVGLLVVWIWSLLVLFMMFVAN